jgi:acetylornithine aminotransferase
MAQGKAAKLMTAGTHGSTFGGNPLACSAALAVLHTLENENLIDQAEQKGLVLKTLFTKQLSDNEHVIDIRNKGMMIGIELSQPCSQLVNSALENDLLINVTAEKTIRLLPPLIINEEQIKLLVDKLSALIINFTNQF